MVGYSVLLRAQRSARAHHRSNKTSDCCTISHQRTKVGIIWLVEGKGCQKNRSLELYAGEAPGEALASEIHLHRSHDDIK